MTGKSKANLALWSSFLTMLLTAVMAWFTIFPRSPVQSAASPSQAQGSWVQPLEKDWRGSLRIFSAVIAGSMVLFASWLNSRAIRSLRAIQSGDRPDNQAAQDRPLPERLEHLPLSMTRPGVHADGEIAVGAKVRLCYPPTEVDKQRCPGWIADLDRYIGQDFVVEKLEPNGLLRLEGLRYDANVAWVVPSEPRASQLINRRTPAR
jgi:hypothetical protein